MLKESEKTILRHYLDLKQQEINSEKKSTNGGPSDPFEIIAITWTDKKSFSSIFF